MILAKVFSGNIRAIRAGKKMTLENVAEVTGLNAKYIGEIERAKKVPSAITIYKLCECFEVSPCQILCDNGCPCIDRNHIIKIERLLEGKKAKEIEKAVKILEVLFSK